MATTPEEAKVARFMLEIYQRQGRLTQSTVAHLIRKEFGEHHLYKNKNHRWGINKGILEEFRRLTPEDTVWSRSTQTWRRRQAYDPPGKRMVR